MCTVARTSVELPPSVYERAKSATESKVRPCRGVDGVGINAPVDKSVIEFACTEVGLSKPRVVSMFFHENITPLAARKKADPSLRSG